MGKVSRKNRKSSGKNRQVNNKPVKRSKSVKKNKRSVKKNKRSVKKRQLNEYFVKMLKAKKESAKSFEYKNKTYYGREHDRLGMVYSSKRPKTV